MMKKSNDSMIELKDITVKIQGKTLLEHFEWTISHGEHWGLLGLNGSGKTTILKLITGFLWPTKGNVTVLGNKFGQVNVQEVRKKIGWVSDALDDRYRAKPGDTALEIAASGKYGSIGIYSPLSRQEYLNAKEALSLFGMEPAEEKVFYQLSQGEKRRVMLARAWLAEPDLLLLDEPCSGLDVKAREDLLSRLESLSKEPNSPAVIYVTHHVEEILPFVTHMQLIKNGTSAGNGRKEEVITSSNLTNTFDVPCEIEWKDNRPWLSITSMK
ncbi:ABC transporter ATP-binding protein [Thalassorhabdus alkalitolerans]|uniref:ABC transporter ATP-binding protein n=1 Tax=Thalassorhabdus alkalitolerans TaxID=2282697 RepID=A0ABW0YKB4_9BACI